jgi:NAD(P)-dependent dehydrogenase (short-subunit alcohol dehydrogenase family)
MFPGGAALVFGATGGLGEAAVRELARAGSDIAICYRSKADKAAALAEEFRAMGRAVSIHQAEVTDPASIAATRDAAVAAHARIHTLVWAAGPLVPQVYLSQTAIDQYRTAIDIEVHGFFAATQSLFEHMREKGGGSFVHLGSAGHLYWPPKDGLSVAPKAANEALIRGIAKEQGKFGIRANSVLVGVIEAGMFLELSRQGVFDDAWTREVQAGLCLKRWGRPEEIGHAVTFLASSRAGYTTGQQIAVAGGYGI